MERSGTDYTRTRTQTTGLAAAPRDYCRTATGLGDRRGVPVPGGGARDALPWPPARCRLSRRRQTMERRQFVKLSGLAGLGAVVPGERVAAQAPGPSARSTGPLLGCQRGPTDVRRLQHFKRHGVDHVCGYPENGADPASWTVEALTALRDRCAAQGVALDMIEFPMLSSASIDTMTPQHEMNPTLAPGLGKAIMLGKDPERQREIEFVQTIIRNCARAGIPAVKYNMNLIGVLRTADTPGRGGTRFSTWRLAEAKEEPPLTAAGRGLRGGRLGAHHLLPRARRPRGHRAQGAARLPSPRPRRAAARLPWRRPRARHRRGDEALRRHRREPVPRAEPLPRDHRRDAAGSRTARSTT